MRLTIGRLLIGGGCFYGLGAYSGLRYRDRMVQITERVLSSYLTTVEIEHTAKAFAAINRIIA